MRVVHLMLAALVALTSAGVADAADTVYKVVAPDGSVIYSDRPPDASKSATLEFRHLPASPLSESAIRFRAEIEKSIKARTAALSEPQAGELRFFTAQWCPHCRRAKAYLAQRRVPFTEYDIETPDGMTAFVQAGGRAVPLLVSSTGRVQGYSEGSYDRFLIASRRP